jgi:hypothetical protein
MSERSKTLRGAPRPGAKAAAYACAIFVAVAAMMMTTACGYRPVGTGFLPAGIRTIQIPLFENRTTRFELDLKLTKALIDELASRGKIKVTTNAAEADAVLEGHILTFAVNPIAFSNQKTADRYNIFVVADVSLKESKSGRIVYANPSYNFTTEYQVPQGQDFESAETEALDNLAKLFARSLIVAILEGF